VYLDTALKNRYDTQMLQNPTDRDSKKFKQQKAITSEEYELSRFKPALKTVIEVFLILAERVEFILNFFICIRIKLVIDWILLHFRM
jgi:hypothetical protein